MNLKTFSPASFASALAVFSATAVVSTAKPADAFFVPSSVTMSYGCVTSGPKDPDPSCQGVNRQTGQNQFKTQVSMNNQNQVLFQFFNIGTVASSITDIYFQDTAPKSLLSIAGIFNSAGVAFSKGANPANLPGGQNVGFNATFSADSNSGKPGVMANGINPGETLGILFNLQPGFSNPMFTAILADLKSGSLRVGLHAQGFSNGGSESFVNQAVPEPLTMLGSGAAIGVGALLKKKGSQSKKQKTQVS
jgi:hypothetical protein